MLLVDHADAQPGELDVGLDQGVRADHAATARRRPGGRAPRRRRAAGVAPVSSVNGTALSRQERRERRGVLLGQRLGGRHQGGLVSGLDCSQHREQGDHRLAAAHLAHQQPLHRPPGAEVGVDLGEGARAGPRSARTAARRASARPARPPALSGMPGRSADGASGAGWQARAWWRKSSSKARRRRACSASSRRSREVGCRRARRASPARPSRARSSAGSGSIASRRPARQRQVHPFAQPRAASGDRRRDAPGRCRSCGAACPAPWRRRSRAPRPGSRSGRCGRASARLVPGCSFSASQAWLNQTAFIGPLASARWPRRCAGRGGAWGARAPT